jgi:hypothetical protein
MMNLARPPFTRLFKSHVEMVASVFETDVSCIPALYYAIWPLDDCVTP